MRKGKGDIMPEIRINTERMDELLDRLSKDEKLRKSFQSNPKAVLTDYDIDIPDELIPDKIELPSPEELQRRRSKAAVSGWAIVTS